MRYSISNKVLVFVQEIEIIKILSYQPKAALAEVVAVKANRFKNNVSYNRC